MPRQWGRALHFDMRLLARRWLLLLDLFLQLSCVLKVWRRYRPEEGGGGGGWTCTNNTGKARVSVYITPTRKGLFLS